MRDHLNTSNHSSQNKDTKKEYTKKLYNTLYSMPISRRMAATKVGFPDQTYMVTQFIFDWIKQGKAAVVGHVKCTRSGRWVEGVTTNPDLFLKTNQLNMF